MSMIVFAAALAAAAAPEPAPVPAPVAAPISPVERSQKISPATDMRRVCIVNDVTGTRFERKTCQTRAEWVAQGVDPLNQR